MDVAAFLSRHPPFDALDTQTLDRVAAALRVEFFPAGTTILDQSGEPARFLYVVRVGAVELLDEGRLLDLLGEGEAFGYLSLVSGLSPTATVRAAEDTLCYLIGPDLAEAILGTARGLAYMGTGLRQRMMRRDDRRAVGADLRTPVGMQIRRPPVTCPAETAVAEAARLMAHHRVSSLLVPTPAGWGILTDRDLRTRVLAAGRSPDAPVADVMSFPARTVTSETTTGEVLLAMLEDGFHHFPVTGDGGVIVGMVTDTDLLGMERKSPFALKSAIERAPSVDAAIEAARTLPAAVCSLVEASADPVDVGHVVGVTVDALTRRLIDLDIARRGAAPVPWAWLALGSQARHEQALHTDQDHAIAFDPQDQDPKDLDPYFGEMATAVTSGLEAAGIRRCNGGAMAENAALRRPLDGWVAAFHGWMADPGVEGSILTSIVFDYRRVAGTLDPEGPLDAVVAAAPERYPQFLRHLARRALDLEPPTGFFRDLVVQAKGEHAGKLDAKHGGITIITNLARAYAVRAGLSEKRTPRRLRAAAAAGQISQESREALEEAFGLLWETRLEHQVAQVRAGAGPDDFVDPGTLGPIRRRALKEAFRIIVREQRTLETDLGVR
jgi:CBS domain-containing protein